MKFQKFTMVLFFFTLMLAFSFLSETANATLDVLYQSPRQVKNITSEEIIPKTSTTTFPNIHTLVEPIYVVKGEYEGLRIRYKNQQYNKGAIAIGTSKYLKVTANSALGGPEFFRVIPIPGRFSDSALTDEATHDPLIPVSLTATTPVSFDGTTGCALYYVRLKIPNRSTTTYTVNIKVIRSGSTQVLEELNVPIRVVSATGVTVMPAAKVSNFVLCGKLRPFKEIDNEQIGATNTWMVDPPDDDDEIVNNADVISLSGDINSPTRVTQEVAMTKKLVDLMVEWRFNEIENFTFPIGSKDESNDSAIASKVLGLTDYIMARTKSVSFQPFKTFGKKKLKELACLDSGGDWVSKVVKNETVYECKMSSIKAEQDANKLKSLNKKNEDYNKEIEHLQKFNSTISKYLTSGRLSYRICDEPTEISHLNIIDDMYGRISATSNYRYLTTVVTRGGVPPTKFGTVDRWYFRSMPKEVKAAEAAIKKIQTDYKQQFGLYLNNAQKLNQYDRRARFIGWVCHTYGINNYLVFGVNHYGAKEEGGKITYHNPLLSRTIGKPEYGNDGMAFFFYLDGNNLYRSIRGEDLRDGFEDYEILEMIKNSTGTGRKLNCVRNTVFPSQKETVMNIMATNYKDGRTVPNCYKYMQDILRCLK